MKNLFKNVSVLLMSIITLTGCNGNVVSEVTENENSTPSVSTSTTKKDVLFDEELSGYDVDGGIKFFQEGYSGDRFKIYSDHIKLLRDTSYLQSKPFENNGYQNFDIELNLRATNLDGLDEKFLGEYLEFKVIGIYKESTNNEDEPYLYHEVDSKTFKYDITQEVLDNDYIEGFPKYSSDFSEAPFTCSLAGAQINSIKFLYLNEPYVNKEGVNIDIHNIKVLGEK